MFKYFLNTYWDLSLKVQESCVKNKSNWNKLHCKNQVFGTFRLQHGHRTVCHKNARSSLETVLQFRSFSGDFIFCTVVFQNARSCSDRVSWSCFKMHGRAQTTLFFSRTVFFRFACPIRLIPIPMVLVKIINGKFGIFEYLEIPKGILVILMTFKRIVFVANKDKEHCGGGAST